eukprot:CAMPEP_0173181148 /NCGR_PEP_ID=MMETSP1141-20130122/7120_1 /TAXON_ID=483371 /ORGANISM="non described non described, Strain CCMP2298" /LENGTH=56 /DNA_ID=CAMNT_0014104097 /DNA_START=69 /DNA_END=235 /DNA_ORIENTATION=+
MSGCVYESNQCLHALRTQQQKLRRVGKTDATTTIAATATNTATAAAAAVVAAAAVA